MNNESKFKHLEFIQLTITRMAANSFLLRGWSISIVSILGVLAQKDTNRHFWMFAVIPAFVFWGLDAYYLRQERLFRGLYNQVREKNEDKIDFSLDTRVVTDVDNWFKTLFSKTTWPFHGVIIASVVLIGIILSRSTTTEASGDNPPSPTATPTSIATPTTSPKVLR